MRGWRWRGGHYLHSLDGSWEGTCTAMVNWLASIGPSSISACISVHKKSFIWLMCCVVDEWLLLLAFGRYSRRKPYLIPSSTIASSLWPVAIASHASTWMMGGAAWKTWHSGVLWLWLYIWVQFVGMLWRVELHKATFCYVQLLPDSGVCTQSPPLSWHYGWCPCIHGTFVSLGTNYGWLTIVIRSVYWVYVRQHSAVTSSLLWWRASGSGHWL